MNPLSAYPLSDKKYPLKWASWFVLMFIMGGAGKNLIFTVVAYPDPLLMLECLFLSIYLFFTAYGLLHLTPWGYKLNLILLIIFPLTLLWHDQLLSVRLTVIAIFYLVWFLPNIIYFRKRKSYFNKTVSSLKSAEDIQQTPIDNKTIVKEGSDNEAGEILKKDEQVANKSHEPLEPSRKPNYMNDEINDHFYGLAQQELDENKARESLLVKLLVHNQGNHELARLEYVKVRARELYDEDRFKSHVDEKVSRLRSKLVTIVGLYSYNDYLKKVDGLSKIFPTYRRLNDIQDDLRCAALIEYTNYMGKMALQPVFDSRFITQRVEMLKSGVRKLDSFIEENGKSHHVDLARKKKRIFKEGIAYLLVCRKFYTFLRANQFDDASSQLKHYLHNYSHNSDDILKKLNVQIPKLKRIESERIAQKYSAGNVFIIFILLFAMFSLFIMANMKNKAKKELKTIEDKKYQSVIKNTVQNEQQYSTYDVSDDIVLLKELDVNEPEAIQKSISKNYDKTVVKSNEIYQEEKELIQEVPSNFVLVKELDGDEAQIIQRSIAKSMSLQEVRDQKADNILNNAERILESIEDENFFSEHEKLNVYLTNIISIFNNCLLTGEYLDAEEACLNLDKNKHKYPDIHSIVQGQKELLNYVDFISERSKSYNANTQQTWSEFLGELYRTQSPFLKPVERAYYYARAWAVLVRNVEIEDKSSRVYYLR